MSASNLDSPPSAPNPLGASIAFALGGGALGWVLSCLCPPFGWALIAPLFTLAMGQPMIASIMLLEFLVAVAVTAVGARVCRIPLKPWIIMLVAAVLTAVVISGYVQWLWQGAKDFSSGPLFG